MEQVLNLSEGASHYVKKHALIPADLHPPATSLPQQGCLCLCVTTKNKNVTRNDGLLMRPQIRS